MPVILLTAKNTEQSTLDGFTSGADDYVVKPFNANILKSRIKNILHNRELLRSLYASQVKISPKAITNNEVDEKFLTKVIQIVEENFENESFSVSLLSNEMFMSKMSLLRKIKAITGENVSDFIISMRLKKAAELLAQTNLTIGEIAENVGYNDQKYFTTSFKRFFNKTPSQYRNT